MLATRFDHRGDLDDIDLAVDMLWTTVGSATELERPGHLSNLAGALLLRYQHRGDTRSLDSAVDCAGRAVRTAPAPVKIDRSCWPPRPGR
ncbi:hypothetical protein [Solwaraspora sp. WMMA2065]|uniref:hypothetical protein n=1 Tax=Solwaraspora sp. WMMA2065 TaxID=3015166 RepID=UPI00259B8D7A|nr:hypothetical protein [Solwaraspora sp. WMMA2065]WJK33082.1 hypothetical protein O7610_20480 [Solwaraspora sp. WMMA2065]